MEAVTAGRAVKADMGTGSKTIADLLPLAVRKYGELAAQRHKEGDGWGDASYAELGETVREVALGLVDLGIQPGDKVSILAHTGPSGPTPASASSPPAAPSSRSTRRTRPRSASTCSSTPTRARSSWRTASSWRRSARSSGSCPDLRARDRDGARGDADWATRSRSRRYASAGAVRDESSGSSATAPSARRHLPLHLHVGHDRSAEGLLLTAPQLSSDHRCGREPGRLAEGRQRYLFLPLAHAFAILIQFVTFDLGATLAYWSRDPKKIISDLTEVNPSYFPSVPRMFEKIYTLATSAAPDKAMLEEGGRGGREGAHGEARQARTCPRLQRAFDQAEEKLYKNVRALFGKEHPRMRHGSRADRAGDPRVLLRLWRARDGGLRDDRDRDQRDRQPPGWKQVPVRLGREAAEGRRGEDRRRRRGPDQGSEHLPGLLQERGRHQGDARGRLAPHRRPRSSRRRRLPLHHRAQEGHHHHRRRQEHHPGQPRERAQAEPLDLAGRGRRRPPTVPRGPGHARPRGGAGARGTARAEEADVGAMAPTRCARRSRRRSTR